MSAWQQHPGDVCVMAAHLKRREQWHGIPRPTMRNIQGCFPTMVEDLYAALPKFKLEVPASRINVEDSWSAADAVRQQSEHVSVIKAERLRQFNEEVRRRVHLLEQMKKRQLLEQSFKALELERSIVRKTAFAAETAVPRAAGCIMQDNLDLVIGRTTRPPSRKSGGSGSSNKCSPGETKRSECRNALSQEHRLRLNARKRLASMKFTANTGHSSPWETNGNEQLASQGHCVSVDLSDDADEEAEPRAVVKKEVSFEGEDSASGSSDDSPKACALPSSSADDAVSCRPLVYAEDAAACLQAVKQQRVVLPNIYSTRDQEEVRKQDMKQRATFRRLFMDIERQQVKEFSRQREHQERIESIRRSKEEERQRQEKLAMSEWLRGSGGGSSEHGRSAGHSRSPALLEAQLQQAQEQARRARKALESKRYLAALRETLHEKADRLGLELPPLCLCSPSPWDTHPDACANNCVFYKNPRVYAAALQNLVSSSCEAT